MARSPVGNQESGGSVNFPEMDDDRYDFLFKVVTFDPIIIIPTIGLIDYE